MTHSSTTLDTLDAGVPIGQRAWPLTSRNCTVPDNYELSNCSEVLVYEILKRDICREPHAFDQFDRQKQASSLIESGLQLVLRCVNLASTSLRSRDTQRLTCNEFPIKIFLEVVLQDEQHHVQDKLSDYDAAQRRIAAEHLHELYGDERCDVDALISGAKSQLDNGAFHQRDLSRMRFMRGHDDREVFAYRFWIAVREPSMRLGDEFGRMLLKTFENYSKLHGEDNDGPYDANVKGGGRGSRGGGGGGIAKLKANQLARDDQRWALIKNAEDWLNFVRVYTGDKRLTQHKFRDECLSARVPLDDRQNEINPFNVLSVNDHFRRTSDSVMREQRQNQRANYMRGNKLSFPLPECVLYVSTQWWTIDHFRHMYTPDMQKRVVEPRLNRSSQLDDDASDDDDADATELVPPAVAGRRTDDNDDDIIDLDGSMTMQALYGITDVNANGDVSESLIDMDDNNNAAGGGGSGGDLIGYDDQSGDPLAPRSRGDQRRRRGGAISMPVDDNDSSVASNSSSNERRIVTRMETLPMSDRPAIDAHMSDIQGDYGPSSEDTAMSIEATAAAEHRNRTHLHTLRHDYYRAGMSFINVIDAPNVRARELLLMKWRCMSEYIAKCTSSGSNVPAAGRIINGWMEQRRFATEQLQKQQQQQQQRRSRKRKCMAAPGDQFPLAHTNCARPFIDARMSTFGVMVVSEYLNYERTSLALTAHSEIFLIRIAAYSSYVYAFDTLRLNVLLYGPEQTSKSWPITVVRNLMIDGTTQALTNESRMAEAHDFDDTDIPRMYEEMPDEIIKAGQNNSDKQNEFKEITTRNVYSRAVCDLGRDGGPRTRRIVKSEKHVAFIGATNMPRYKMDRAVVSREVMRHQVERKRPGVDIAEKTLALQNPTQQTMRQQSMFTHNMRLGQALHYHMEKGNMVGFLTQPTLTTLALVYPRYKRTLRERFAITIGRRVDDQIKMYVHKLVIENAQRWLYYSPASPFYMSECVSFWHLLILDPLLHDSEEIVYFALDQFRDSLIDPNNEAVKECLRTVFVPRLLKKKSLISLFESYADRARRSSENAAKTASRHGAGKTTSGVGAGAGSGGALAKSFELDQLVSGGGGADDGEASKDAGSAHDKRDYNFVCFPMSLKKLAQNIANSMRSYKSSRNLDQATVFDILKDMTMRKVISPPFIKRQATVTRQVALDPSKPHQLTDQTTFRDEVVPDADKPTNCYAALRISEDQRAVYLHSSFVFGTQDDPHETAIKDSMTAWTPRTKMVSGLPYDDKNPHLLRVRETAPTNFMPLVDELPIDDGAEYRRSRAARGLSMGTGRWYADDEEEEDEEEDDDDDEDSSERNSDDDEMAQGDYLFNQIIDEAGGNDTGSTNRRPVRRKVAIGMSYDEYATRSRLLLLGIPLTRKAIGMCNFLTSDDHARKQPKALSKTPIDYPQRLLEASAKSVERNEQLNKSVCHIGLAAVRAGKAPPGFTINRRAYVDDLDANADEWRLPEQPLPTPPPPAASAQTIAQQLADEQIHAPDPYTTMAIGTDQRANNDSAGANDYASYSKRRRMVQDNRTRLTMTNGSADSMMDLGLSNGPGLSGVDALHAMRDGADEQSFFDQVIRATTTPVHQDDDGGDDESVVGWA